MWMPDAAARARAKELGVELDQSSYPGPAEWASIRRVSLCTGRRVPGVRVEVDSAPATNAGSLGRVHRGWDTPMVESWLAAYSPRSPADAILGAVTGVPGMPSPGSGRASEVCRS